MLADAGRQPGQHLARVLVGEGAEQEVGRARQLAGELGDRRDARRVVGAVEDHGAAVGQRHRLEPPRPAALAGAARDRLLVEAGKLESTAGSAPRAPPAPGCAPDGARGARSRARARAPRSAAGPAGRPARGGRLRRSRPGRRRRTGGPAAPAPRRAAPPRTSPSSVHAKAWRPGRKIPAFSRAIAARVVSQVLAVIERDRGDEREDRLGGVGRVEPAAHPDLDHRELDLRRREVGEGGGGQRLEVGRRRAVRLLAGRDDPRQELAEPLARRSRRRRSASARSGVSRWGEL